MSPPSSESTPAFARDFPSDAELSALVTAFAEGNYRRVRAEAPKVAARTEDARVRAAAGELAARTGADPTAKVLLALTLALLATLTAWWIGHGRAPLGAQVKAPPTVERIP